MKKKLFIIAGIVLLLDMIVKQIIIHTIIFEETIMMIPNFFYITYVKNTGGAWSIFQDNFYLLLFIGIIVSFLLCYYLMKKKSLIKIEVIAYSLLLGGLFGNLIDRIIYRAVIDYLGFIFGTYHYPIFNLADICIVLGVFILIFIEFRGDKSGINSESRKCEN